MSWEELGRLLLGTFELRPYVFAFLTMFLIVSLTHLGFLRTLIWLFVGYGVAFASEYCSVRTGFPYGLYHYLPSRTLDKELWVAGVPFMDSLSYVFLTNVAFLMALQMTSPTLRRGCDIRPADTARHRRSLAVLLLAPLLFTLLDVVIDPVALRGERWFLGRIYYYPEEGIHFGVPISNYLGWYLVGFTVTLIMQTVDRLLPPPARTRGAWSFAGQAWLVPCLYFGILAMNVSVTFWIGERLIGTCSTILSLTLLVFWALLFCHPRARADLPATGAHLNELGPGWARTTYGP